MKKLNKFKILEPMYPNKTTGIVGGQASGILNWNDIPYPHFYENYKLLQGNNWTADSINMGEDKKGFPKLTKKEQDVYLTIAALLATFDMPQSRMMLKVSDYVTDPAVQSLFAYIAKDEAEHNRSYSYLLFSVVKLKDQINTFELARTHPQILKRNKKVMAAYDEFMAEPTVENMLTMLVYSSCLEGIFFYSGFAFYYNLARQQKMVGTQTMISYINRDELAHGRITGDIMRAILGENPEYNTPEFTEKAYDIIRECTELEVDWSYYLLEGIDGIDTDEMADYIKYRANKVARVIGLENLYEDQITNPMPWIKSYVDNFNGVKTDFFEQRNRAYTKPTADNGFDDL